MIMNSSDTRTPSHAIVLAYNGDSESDAPRRLENSLIPIPAHEPDSHSLSVTSQSPHSTSTPRSTVTLKIHCDNVCAKEI